MSKSPVEVGDILAGKFRVERVLGVGGMGVVVAATHLQLGQNFAIKLLLAEALENQEALRRFVQEAQAAASIQSEHVVRVHDVSALDNGAPYMVMEYLEGNDLSSTIRKRGPLPVPEAVDYILQASEAIAEAHVAGIIHRDLKPANLFLTRRADGSSLLKVLDFGISKLIPKAEQASSLGAMTRTRALMGSPSYMSPEQMRSTRNVSPRSDIWGLGIILYEMLTASLPFVGETMTEICASVLDEPFPSLRQKRPDLPLGLEAVAARCCEKRAELRFRDVADLAEALAPFAPEHAVPSVRRIARVVRGAGDPSATGKVPPPPSSPTSLPSSVPISIPVSVPGAAADAASGDLPVQDTHALTLATFGGTLSKLTRSRRAPVAAAATLLTALTAAVVVFVALRRPQASELPPTTGSSPPSVVTIPAPPDDSLAHEQGPGPAPAPPSTFADAPDAGTRGARKPPGHQTTKPIPRLEGTAGFGHGID